MAWDDRDEGKGGSLEYTFTCYASRAGFTDYNEGNTALLILEGEAEFDNGNVIDKHLWIGTPSMPPDVEGKWSVTDDGFFFVHTGDPDARFGRNSKMQKFISSALKAGVPLKERGENSLDARPWAGLRLRIREEEVSWERDGEQRTYQQPLVMKYLGEVDVPATIPTSSAASATPKASRSNGSNIEAAATVIAKKYAENEDFVAYITDASAVLHIPLDHEVCSMEFFKAAIAS